jgi:hypothetical protein
MLSSGLGVVGFSWAASPACTELETIVVNWLGKMYGLPKTLLPFEEVQSDESLPSSPMTSNQNTEDEFFVSSDNSSVASPTPNATEFFSPHSGGGVILVNNILNKKNKMINLQKYFIF